MKKRNVIGNKVNDPSAIAALTYNDKSGAQKNTEVGRKLIPLKADATTFTTNATTAKALPSAGKNLAIYNNANAVGAVTFGEDATISSLAAGVTDSAGHVGIPCMPNDWTYVAAGDSTHVISSAATLLVFVIDDDTNIQQQTSR